MYHMPYYCCYNEVINKKNYSVLSEDVEDGTNCKKVKKINL